MCTLGTIWNRKQHIPALKKLFVILNSINLDELQEVFCTIKPTIAWYLNDESKQTLSVSDKRYQIVLVIDGWLKCCMVTLLCIISGKEISQEVQAPRFQDNRNIMMVRLWVLRTGCLYPQEILLLEAESNPGPQCGRKDINKKKFQWLTYLITPRCRVLLEKLTGMQLVKKFPSFHGTRRFITALTSVRHLSLSWASPIQSIYPHPTSWRSILILSTHLCLGLPSGLLPSGFPSKLL